MLKNKICFVSLETYPILAEIDYKTAGGAEVLQVLIAKELKKYGFRISFVVGDYGQKPIKIIDGIKVIKSFRLYYGNRKIRFLPDMALLYKAMRIADADVYYISSPLYLLGQIELFCKIYHKKLIFKAASIRDCDINYVKSLQFPIRYLYPYGISHADIVVAENGAEKMGFKKNFGVESILIKNGIAITKFQSPQPINHQLPVLWVGTLIKLKRPELFLKLASNLPEINFRLIGAPSKDKTYNEKIAKLAKDIPNLEYMGFIPHPNIYEYFNKASLFVNTSESLEGFPITFLEAWASYIPVVSLEVDPDECICENGIGLHSKTFEKMVEDVRLLIENEELRKEMGFRARRYAEREHNIEEIGKQYVNLLDYIVSL